MSSEWRPKRFWTETAAVRDDAGGWRIELDGRPVRTPGKSLLRLPTAAMAELVRAEWAAQVEVVDPGTMPATRMSNSALEKVGPAREAVLDMLADYGATDLLCYRAEGPESLVARQRARWDPMLDWAATALDARLRVTVGVMPADQPPEAVRRMRAALDEGSDFRLGALYDLVTLSGSLVLALAVDRRRIDAAEGWRLSRLDEDWQQEEWGVDEDAAAQVAHKRAAFLDAERVLHAVVSESAG